MLNVPNVIYYKVKKGQTLGGIAAHFSCPERLIVQENGLKEEVFEGQVLKLPQARANLYTARAGDEKTLLSGTESAYNEKNGVHPPYPGQKIYL
ncbi:MAG: LysM peptidoglycan-binding domain-containing protein [Clostridia bacterium]|nr:LysM peptidoglycan-binding domain-containing protein [Clostridia bacterium]